MFSSQRCELLKLIPAKTTDWLLQFEVNLREQKVHYQAAMELANYLSHGESINQELLKKLREYQQSIRLKPATKSGLEMIYQQLIDLRKSVYTSEISQNPLGQILEPGFRVIFPESKLSFIAAGVD